jgi:hypothetical protein
MWFTPEIFFAIVPVLLFVIEGIAALKAIPFISATKQRTNSVTDGTADGPTDGPCDGVSEAACQQLQVVVELFHAIGQCDWRIGLRIEGLHVVLGGWN